MRGFIQVACVVAIAVGAGLFAFGSQLEPRANILGTVAPSLNLNSSEFMMVYYMASVSCGFGISFMILGTIGLFLPWVNKIAFAEFEELGENSARAIATLAIWLSIAVILTFGVFHLNWEGGAAMSVLLIIVALISAVATICTAIVYGWQPWARTSRVPQEGVRHQV